MKLGELEINKVYEMDCIEGMKMLPDKCIDLTVTSPPYDNLRDYGSSWIFDYKGTIKELYRVTKTGGVVVWVVGDQTINGSETGTSFKQALFAIDCGFNLHDTMIYQKSGSPMSSQTRYLQSFEYMFVFTTGRPVLNIIKDRKNRFPERWGKGYKKRQKNGEFKSKKWKVGEIFGARFNIWKYHNLYNYRDYDQLQFQHPATFPENLAKDHIYSWSNKGDIILDPFMGSGTTAKMAISLDRDFIGFEIEAKYCEIANKRIDAERNQLKIFV